MKALAIALASFAAMCVGCRTSYVYICPAATNSTLTETQNRTQQEKAVDVAREAAVTAPVP